VDLEHRPVRRPSGYKIPWMSRSELPDDIRRFILTSVPSVPYLEAILLLRADPDALWDVRRVAARLYVAERQASEVLTALAAAGIADSEDHGDTALFRYAPATAELRDRLDALAHAYSANLVGMTDLIHSRIDKRAQQFADAFRLRKDSGKED
jgi:Mn-dependent DtxR family transcriptional regulator